MEIARRNRFDEQKRVGLLLLSLFEFLIIAGMCVLAYILRETNYFPIRRVRFQCSDADISAKQAAGQDSMSVFTFNADISYSVVITLSFCLPPFMILLCEIVRWQMTTSNAMLSISFCCVQCKVSTTLRRIIRFDCVFIVGMLTTLIFTDIIKLFVGRMRPIFLEICQPNRTLCASAAAENFWLNDDIMCLQSASSKLRWARQSFPSLHSSATAYSALFLALYWQNVMGYALRARTLGPVVSFGSIIMSLMCGLSRYALYYSHWTDVAVGLALGAAIALYISVFTLRNFRENSEISGQMSSENLPTFDTYNSSGFQYQRERTPWHLTPWQLVAQNRGDTQTDRLAEAAYYNVSMPQTSNPTPEADVRRPSVRVPGSSKAVVHPDYAY